MLPTDPTRAYYDLHASEYFAATIEVELKMPWACLAKELHPQDQILDLGCGSGRDLLYFAQLGFCTVGLDYSFELLKLAASFSRRPVVQANIMRIPFDAGSFDAVWSSASLLHLNRRDLKPSLIGIHRVLRKDGYLLMTLKAGKGESIDSLGRFTSFYEPVELQAQLTSACFEILQMEESVELRGEREQMPVPWLLCLCRKTQKELS
jgi:SAM-dependent methyltransferase